MHYRFLRFPGGKAKAVTLSYDDGSRYDIKLSNIITNYGFKATFNINSNNLFKNNGDYYLSPSQVTEHLLSKGHEIAIHGADHIAAGLQTTADAIKNTVDCRSALEKEFGIIIRGMAYADSGIRRFKNGLSYPEVKQCLTALDIAYSRTLSGDNKDFFLPEDWHAWMPNAHHDNPEIFEFIDAFLALDCDNGYINGHQPRLFYIWGHSQEFNNKNNWERLEEICQRLGGKEEIWYATNGEIYDYVTAYNSLIFSADNSIVHNPSAKTVWFKYGKKPYSIKPGETIVIDSEKC